MILWIALGALLVLADQYTKYLAYTNLAPHGTAEFIPHLMRFTYVENAGAAFGIMQNARWIFVVLTVAVFIAFIYYLVKYKPTGKLLLASLTFIAAGAMGNFIDRLINGYVIDFLDFEFIDFPKFNIADSCVTIGAVLLIIYVFFFQEVKKDGEQE